MLRVYCKKEEVKNEIFVELLSRASVTARPHKGYGPGIAD